MPVSPRALCLLLAAVLLAGPACRKVSQPALNGTATERSLLPVEQHGAWGYITRTGSLAVAPQFDRAYRFSENRALIQHDGRYGFIDERGEVVIPPTFRDAGHFAAGMAPVRPDSLWGFIDRSGTMVVSPQFTEVAGREGATQDRGAPPTAAFSRNRARVLQNGRWGYVTREGTPVIPAEFERAGPFREGRARVHWPDGRMGYIDRSGTVVWSSAR